MFELDKLLSEPLYKEEYNVYKCLASDEQYPATKILRVLKNISALNIIYCIELSLDVQKQWKLARSSRSWLEGLGVFTKAVLH